MFAQAASQVDFAQVLLASIVVPTVLLLLANLVASARAPFAARV